VRFVVIIVMLVTKQKLSSLIARFVTALTMVANLANFAQRMVAIGLSHWFEPSDPRDLYDAEDRF